jgi:hypothetical protein
VKSFTASSRIVSYVNVILINPAIFLSCASFLVYKRETNVLETLPHNGFSDSFNTCLYVSNQIIRACVYAYGIVTDATIHYVHHHTAPLEPDVSFSCRFPRLLYVLVCWQYVLIIVNVRETYSLFIIVRPIACSSSILSIASVSMPFVLVLNDCFVVSLSLYIA